MSIFFLYIALGAVAGVLAGLLGIGGGLVIVPMLTFAFTAQGVPHAHILHMALGTSLASILFTSLSSVRSHHKRGAVEWTVLKSITPGILVGTFAGTWVASRLSTNFLKIFFALFLCYVATQMLLAIKPRPTRQLPKAVGMSSAGGVIGIFSSLVGIGGGTLSVPFLVWHNIPMHHAIGTASAIGFPIAVAGTLGFIINGWDMPGRPALSLGYIQFTALAGIVCASVLTAPLGARLAHSLPVTRLKKIFAVLLYVVAIRMIASIF